MSRRRILTGVAAAALCSACTVGPDYQPPETGAPPAWISASTSDPVLDGWWTRFGDPLLNELVASAVADNLDLRIAVARIAQARARRGIAGSAYSPQIDAVANGSSARDAFPGNRGGYQGVSGEVGTAELVASWELDLFGRIARSVESADADLAASGFDLQAVRLAIASEVARNYLALRGAENRIALQRQGFQLQSETAALTRRLFEAGEIGSVDRDRAEAQAANTAATIPPLEAERQTAAYRLGVLTGRAPGALLERLAQQAQPTAAPDGALAAGAPADLVRRRPDVRAEERRLAASFAQIGVATADLYPRLTLTGSVGGVAGRTDGGSFSTVGVWSIGAGLLGPIFDGGRRRATVRLRRAEADEALHRYRLSVLQAFEDVERALVRYDREGERRASLAEAVSRFGRANRSIRRAWRAGEISFLDVLDSDRSLIAARDALAASEAELRIASVRVYAALGGGWQDAEIPGQSTPPAQR